MSLSHIWSIFLKKIFVITVINRCDYFEKKQKHFEGRYKGRPLG